MVRNSFPLLQRQCGKCASRVSGRAWIGGLHDDAVLPGCVIVRVAISTSATLIGPLTAVDFALLKLGGGTALWALTSASSQAAIAIGATARPSSQVVTSLLGQPSCSARSAALHLRVFRHSRNRPGIMSNLPAVRWSSRGLPPSSRSSRPRPEARPALHDPLLTDVADADTCCAARNISVEAAVRRLQPADSAMSISPSSSGFSALLHSVSWARNSLAGCVGDGTLPIPVIIFMASSEVGLTDARSRSGSGQLHRDLRNPFRHRPALQEPALPSSASRPPSPRW